MVLLVCRSIITLCYCFCFSIDNKVILLESYLVPLLNKNSSWKII